MQFLVFGHQLIFGLYMSRVGLASFHRTNLRALGRIVSTNAFSTLIRVDFIGSIALTDCFIRALAITRSTTDAIIGNLVRHYFLLDYFKNRLILFTE
jgi:hypothetical protein